MAVFSFQSNVGTSLAFDPAVDILEFGGGIAAAAMRLRSDGPDTIVIVGGSEVRLVNASYGMLATGNFSFLDGSDARLATSAGADSLSGGSGHDYFDIAHGGGGDDTVVAGHGSDVVFAGDTLSAGDHLDGGTNSGPYETATDTLVVTGGTVVFGATTVTGFEQILLEGSASLTLHQAAVTNSLMINASTLTETDAVVVNGAAVATGSLYLTGGDGADTLTGGGGADVITGGLGGDTLNGGSGNDRFVFNISIPRSDSSPISTQAIDTVVGFEGAGVAGGDLIDLPAFADGKPLAFNENFAEGHPRHYSFQFTGLGNDGVQMPAQWVGDGFVDVLWQYNATASRVEVWVDANDDGQFSEGDLLIYFSGITALSLEDFVDNFPAWRGSEYIENVQDGNDTKVGNGLNNIFYGVSGNDHLTGLGGADTLHGGLGDDHLEGDSEADVLYGEDGDDLLEGGAGNDNLSGGTGNDTLYGGDDGDVLYAGNLGSGSGDAITDVNEIHGDGGDDSLIGAEGFDTLYGGAGADSLMGQDNDDQLYGGDNNDTLEGGGGDDMLDGGEGNDVLNGSGVYYAADGNDTLKGGGGDDDLRGMGGIDTLNGGTGVDEFGFWASDSTFAAMDLIEDFNRAEGDRLALFDNYLGLLVPTGRFGGANTLLAFHATELEAGFLYDGFALPDYDRLHAGFTQVWWGREGGDYILIADVNDDSELSGNDFVLRISAADTTADLTTADFVSRNFRVLIGTPDNDTAVDLPGTDEADIMYGVDGNDTLDGLEGDDEIHGGEGIDDLTGGDDNDRLYGENGDDVLHGGDGSDTLSGGAGSDTLTGGIGNDQLYAGSFSLESGDLATDHNTLDGEAGQDYMYGAEGTDTLNGGSENDFLYGASGDDTLNGGDHDDTLDGGEGSDILNGDDGNDTLNGRSVYYLADGDDVMSGGAGTDMLRGMAGMDTLTGGDDDDEFAFWGTDSGLAAQDKITDFDRLEGDKIALLDTFTGSTLPNGRFGGTNNLLVFRSEALTGNFLTNGSALGGYAALGSGFTQVFWGVDGADIVVIADTDDDGVLDDTDFVLRLQSPWLNGGSVLTMDDFADDNFRVLMGTQVADTLTGTTEKDIIYGLAGNDTINGLAGDDEIFGGADNDEIHGGEGYDRVNGGSGDDIIYGDDFYDELTGGAGSDTLYGGDEQDVLYAGNTGNSSGDLATDTNTLEGGGGNDLLYGAEGIDTLRGGADNDTLMGAANNDFLYGDANDDTLDGGEGGDHLYGGTGDDTLNGTGVYYLADGNDVLDGGADNDKLRGMGGADDLTGGTGADEFAFWASDSTLENRDIITDFNRAEGDKIVFLDNFSGSTNPNGRFGDTNKILVYRYYEPSSFFVGELTVGMQLTRHAELGPGFIQVFYGTDGDGGNTVIIADTNDDGYLSATDFVVEIAGSIHFNINDFTPGTFLPIVGTLDNDTTTTMPATSGNDLMYGLGGADVISGLAGNDTMFGGADNDTLSGNGGADSLHGDAGDDILNGDDDNDLLVGGAGSDTLNGGNETDTLYAGSSGLSTGDQASDVNTLNGGAGDDYLLGAEGMDSLYGGADNDTLNGADNDDALRGQDGNDILRGDGGSDYLNGGAGNDTLYGSNAYYLADGDDTLLGGSGQDVLYGMAGSDTLTGGADADDFAFFSTDSTTAVRDRVTDFNRAEGDRIVLLDLFSGSSNPFGRFGQANAILVFGGDPLTAEHLGAGFIQIWVTTLTNGTSRIYTDDGAGGYDFVVDFSNVPGGITKADFAPGVFQALVGTSINDTNATIAATDNADWIFGVGGDDTISGLVGSDDISGGDGADTLHGNEGHDQLRGDAGNDVIYGDEGFDSIQGGAGGDTLYGGLDTDYLYAGDMSYAGDAATDVNYLYGEAGADWLFASTGQNYLYGGSDGDSLYGWTGNDYLNGGSGVDSLYGQQGDDILAGGTLGDHIDGGEGNDTADYTLAVEPVQVSLDGSVVATGEADDDLLISIENLTGTLNGADLLVGDGIANILSGLGGADELRGQDGADTLIGGTGADILSGGTGADRFAYANVAESTLSQFDRITDWETADQIDLTALDANAGAGGIQRFTFLGERPEIDGASLGQISYYHSGGNTYVVAGVDGNSLADLKIEIEGVHTLTTDSFVGLGRAFLTGTAGADTLKGTSGDDMLVGMAGRDMLTGGAGSDQFVYTAITDSPVGVTTRDVILEWDSSDIIDLDAIDADSVTAGIQHFTFRGQGSSSTVSPLGELKFFQHANGNTYVVGGVDANTASDFQIEIRGLHNLTTDNFRGLGRATLTGTANADTLKGTAFADSIDGSGGADTLLGLGGKDTLTGGTGNDIFAYRSVADSAATVTDRDVILDFEAGDRIDLSELDADSATPGIQGFTYRGQVATTSTSALGDLKFYQHTNGNTYVIAGVDANSAADFQLEIRGLHNLTIDNFIGLGRAVLTGTAAGETLTGTIGDDILTGLGGKDTLYGGLGGDTFAYKAVADSPATSTGRDVIMDFELGDRIDLSELDADSATAGIQRFTYRGQGTTSNVSPLGELKFYQHSNGNTYVVAGVDANTASDFQIEIRGHHGLTADNFIGLGRALLTGTAGAETLKGTANADTIDGLGGADTLIGGGARDTLTGGTGNDNFVYRSTTDSTATAAGRDIIMDFETGDRIDLSELDADSATAGIQHFSFMGQGPANSTTGQGELKFYQHTNGNTYLIGGVDGNTTPDFQIEIAGLKTLTVDNFVGLGRVALTGTAGADTLKGSSGNDLLTGLGGKDTLTGGAGGDMFIYKAASDSPATAGGRDVIMDWDGDDRIDLTAIDADSVTGGIQHFAFLGQGTTAATTAAGELKFYQHSNGNTYVVAGIDGNTTPDFQIEIRGLHVLNAGDFLLS